MMENITHELWPFLSGMEEDEIFDFVAENSSVSKNEALEFLGNMPEHAIEAKSQFLGLLD